MEIPNTWAPMLVSSVGDAVLYHENLLKSETLRDRDDYEEHLLQLTQFLEFIKSQYKGIEVETGIPLEKLL
ncbi:MAG: hypothetical protein ACRBBW_14060 [Cellvibrionaceae bacterium]